GINQRKTDLALQYPTIGCFEPVNANGRDAEISQKLGRNPVVLAPRVDHYFGQVAAVVRRGQGGHGDGCSEDSHVVDHSTSERVRRHQRNSTIYIPSPTPSHSEGAKRPKNLLLPPAKEQIRASRVMTRPRAKSYIRS